MRYFVEKYARHIISQIPMLLVLLDLHFEGILGHDHKESMRLMSSGNQLLNAGQLADALSKYHAAIDNDKNNYQAYYMRATVYLGMGKARAALPDLNQVVNLQPSFVNARLQRGNLFLKMGKLNEAQADYQAVLAHEENAEAVEKVQIIQPLRRNVQMAQQYMERNQFINIVDVLSQVIDTCPWNAEFREMRSEAYERLGDLRKAITDLKPTVSLRLDNTKAYLKMSVMWYQLGDIGQSLEEIRECLKLDPDHKECYAHYKKTKKMVKSFEAGKTKMEEQSWEEAITKFTKVLTQESAIVPLTVEIKLKLCECYLKMNDGETALHTIDEVIELDGDNIPARLLRSEADTLLEDYQAAVDDLRKAMEIDENYPGIQDKLNKAQKMLKQSKKRDYYKILGVPRNARKQEIIKAYRKLAREWHPDNFHDETEKKQAENKFIEIAAAKEVLTDPEMRQKFDSGIDPLDAEQQSEQNQGGRRGGFNPFGQGFKFNFGGGHGGGFHYEF